MEERAWSAERCARLLEKCKQTPNGWKACCPAHEDRNPSLFLADGQDGLALVCYAGCDYRSIAQALEAKGAVLSAWQNRTQIPEEHFQLGRYHSYWDYRDVAGRVVMRICRWEQPGGKKDIRPLIRDAEGWKWGHPANPRPLFQLDRLAGDLEATILITEGEKAAAAAQKLFPFCIATTWPGGAQAMGQADWTPLTARSVILFPDCDIPGRKAMAWVAKHLRPLAQSVRIVDPGKLARDLPLGWDLADALKEGRDVSKWLEGAQHEDAESPPRFPMRWSELEGREAPLRLWRINYWLTVGPTLLAGKGGVGKTLIAQTIATALALGRRFLDDVESAMTVLFWACEDDHDELWRRQLAICRFFGVKLSELEGKLIIEPRLGRDNTLLAIQFGSLGWTPLRAELASQVNDYKADVVFLDNIGQTFGGGENNRHDVTMFVNGLAGLASDRPLTSVLLGHPAKQVDSEFSGSTAWENAVRMRWYMGPKLPDEKPEEDAVEDDNVRYLAKRKTNYTVKDYRKLTYQEGVFRPEEEVGPFTQRYGFASRNESSEDCVLEALKRLTEAGIRVTDGRTSPDYLPKKMRELKLSHDFTPRELSDAVGRLRLAGKIGEGAVGQYGNRTPKMGLRVGP